MRCLETGACWWLPGLGTSVGWELSFSGKMKVLALGRNDGWQQWKHTPVSDVCSKMCACVHTFKTPFSTIHQVLESSVTVKRREQNGRVLPRNTFLPRRGVLLCCSVVLLCFHFFFINLLGISDWWKENTPRQSGLSSSQAPTAPQVKTTTPCRLLCSKA